MDKDILLTGATGFIGSALLHTWLCESDATLHLLVRPRRDKSPQDRVVRLLATMFPDTEPAGLRERMVIHSGDVTAPRLGLRDAEYERLSERISHIIHCAASARFDLDLAQARFDNLGGVRNILSFAESVSHLQRLDYVGTAYRLGECERTVYERDHDAGAFRNTYEQSKFESETLLLNHMTRLPIMIARPSIVICDSRSGAASDHNGFCRALMAYMAGQLTVLPGSRNGLLDIVPVDFVSAALFRLCSTTESIGGCYHLTAGAAHTYTLSDLQAMSARHSGLTAFHIVEPNEQPLNVASPLGELLFYMPYLCCKTRFDNADCTRVTGLHAPNLCTYYHRFIDWIRTTMTAAAEVTHA